MTSLASLRSRRFVLLLTLAASIATCALLPAGAFARAPGGYQAPDANRLEGSAAIRIGATTFTATSAVGQSISFNRCGSGGCQFESLGGIASSAPAIVQSSRGLTVFVRGTDNGLYANSRNTLAPVLGTWSGWSRIASNLASGPAAASRGTDLRIHLAYRGANNQLYLGTYNAANGMTWLPARGGTLTSAPALIMDSNAQGAVAVRGTDNAMYVMTTGDGISWSGYQYRGGSLTSAPQSVGNNSFALCGTDTQLYSMTFMNAASGFTSYSGTGSPCFYAPVWESKVGVS